MEAKVRGILEQEIEEFTESEVIKRLFIEATHLTTKNAEDVLFGVIIGLIFGRWLSFSNLKRVTGVPIEKEEVQEFWDMIEKRAMYIRGRIKVALGE
jgi:prolipoprotein diacylglyceryltransferase